MLRLTLGFLLLPLGVLAAEPVAPSYEKLASLDFAELKTALEQAGWPAHHVQAFLGAEIQKRLAPPDAVEPSDFGSFEFWRTGPDAEPLARFNTPERRAERARREEAARQVFDSLFPDSEPAEHRLLRAWEEQRQWGNLSAEKRAAIDALRARTEKERDALLHSRGGMLTPDEHRQLWKIVETARAEIARLLTPDELLDYDLRNSATANRMRAELDNFQPTRDEFLALFKLRHPLELAFAHKFPGQIPEVDRARETAEASVEKSIAALLGPARYDEYRLSLQPALQTLQFDGRYARTDAATVRRLYRALLAAQASLHKTATLPEPEQKSAREKIKAALHAEFRAVFDEEGTRRYLQEQGLWP